MKVLSFSEGFLRATQLANTLEVPVEKIKLHHFPDGESLVQLPAELPETLVIYQSLDKPNEKLVDLMLAADTARQLGVRQLILIAPYLCYMRQDKAFQKGQAISQKVIGRFLADYFDVVITVDPHLHRTHDIHQAIPASNAIVISASELIGEFIQTRKPHALLIGPDRESEQWVSAVSRTGNLDFVVADKIRLDDSSVKITLPEFDYRQREVVLVDDMISTARTMSTTARMLTDKDVKSVDVITTHALFMGDAEHELRSAGVSQIWSTDSVLHTSNVIPLRSLLAESISHL